MTYPLVRYGFCCLKNPPNEYSHWNGTDCVLDIRRKIFILEMTIDNIFQHESTIILEVESICCVQPLEEQNILRVTLKPFVANELEMSLFHL